MADGTRKLAELLGDTFRRAAVDASAEAAPAHHAARIEAERAHLDRMEEEIRPLTTMIRDAVVSGEYGDAFNRLLDQAATPEHAGELFSLLNNVILAFTFSVMQAISTPLLQPLVNERWTNAPNVPLSPAEMALNVLRGYSTEADGVTEAQRSGINADRFHTLIENTGEPPAIGEMLLLYRRGQITRDDLVRAVKQSRIKPEWIDQVVDLQFAPPGAGEVIAAAVEGHLDEATARTKVGEAGVNPDNFDWMLATAGRPPGTQEMIALLNRGVVSEAEVVDAIRESNVKNKYIPAILQTRVHLIPYRSVVSLVTKGLLSPAEGAAKLKLLGFSDADAAVALSGSTSNKVSAAKHASEAQLVTGYRDGLLSRAGLVNALVAINYAPAEAEYLATLADYARAHTGQTQAIGVVRGAYVRRRIDRPTASNQLDQLGVDPQSRDHLLDLWTIEQADVFTDLTAAQLTAAFKKQIIDEATYRARLTRHGYSAGDVDIMVALAAPAA
jgi:hypothetical protein